MSEERAIATRPPSTAVAEPLAIRTFGLTKSYGERRASLISNSKSGGAWDKIMVGMNAGQWSMWDDWGTCWGLTTH